MPAPEAAPHGPLCDHPYAGTVVLALAYWGLSHLAWMAFHALGVLPLPIWPAAGLAFAVAIHGGWRATPGLALGAFLANLVSLGAPWAAAAGICVMNSVGPVLGAALLRRQVTRQLHIRSVADLLICLGIAIVLVPMLTAVGGVGTTWLFGLTTTAEAPIRLAKWVMAHATGTVLVGVPVLIWLRGRGSCV